MKILLTGATGYIGRRLLPVLLEQGHELICCVRDKNRFDHTIFGAGKIQVIEVNFLDPGSLSAIPDDIDAAYYLIHSMSSSTDDFESLERSCAENFRERINQTGAKQVIYLSGIVNEAELSAHLGSRKGVEEVLSSGTYALTTLRAGIIVGSGSASFEIIRDLVEKLPAMITPRWVETRSQPLAVRNVIEFLTGVLWNEKTFNNSFDIGGPAILTYKEMMLQFAKVRGLKRWIRSVPVMTPKLSSYWLYFVTSTSYKLAINLVDSMKIEIIGKPNQLADWLDIELIPYEEAVRLAFDKIEQQGVLSSWTDAMSGDALEQGTEQLIEVPTYGCFKDERQLPVEDEARSLKKIWSIGGENGWYYANWLWEIRGFIDKLAGGVGLRRGRKNRDHIATGETLDFWRVIYASQADQRLLLYAEMKLPGEAWLEFRIKNKTLHQTATFRPRGIWGRLYWYAVLPFHGLIFGGMLRKIAR